jgi:hypothetical protein
MEPYTLAANRALIYRAYRDTEDLQDTSETFLEWLAALPDSFTCCRPRPERTARRQ